MGARLVLSCHIRFQAPRLVFLTLEGTCSTAEQGKYTVSTMNGAIRTVHSPPSFCMRTHFLQGLYLGESTDSQGTFLICRNFLSCCVKVSLPASGPHSPDEALPHLELHTQQLARLLQPVGQVINTHILHGATVVGGSVKWKNVLTHISLIPPPHTPK